MPSKMVVSSSKSSTGWMERLDTVTCTEVLRPPAETVTVPSPGIPAVKFPRGSMVPIPPSTVQVKASGSAFSCLCW